MSGPCVTPCSVPGPTLSAFTRSASFAAKASYTLSWTKIRLAHTQVWPALRYFDTIAPSAAASRSASSNTMKGALPPSSSEIFLMVGATCFISKRPTSFEPVNDSLRTVALAHISPPIARDDVPHAGRETRAMSELGERERGIGRRLGRLDDDRASRGQRGRHLARDHR